MNKAGLYLQSVFYCLAGINHFWHTATYIQIMPPWIPWPYFSVYFSGFCEIAFGLLLIPRPTRKAAAWLIIVLLIFIFPANLQMLLNSIHAHRPDSWLSMARLPLQLLLIWWAYLYTGHQNNKPRG
jgi:uncharacterized membrane protein